MVNDPSAIFCINELKGAGALMGLITRYKCKMCNLVFLIGDCGHIPEGVMLECRCGTKLGC